MIKPIAFTNNGQKLVGIMHIPESLEEGRKAPGIVMFHGFTGNRTEAHRLFVQVARNLCSSGYVVLRFDFRGSGDSDGDFEDMTLPGEVSDAQRAISYISIYKVVDKNKIGVIGLSMGGRVAAILASIDKRVKFAVLYSAPLGPLKERFFSLIDKEKIEALNSGLPIKVGEGWYLKKPFFDTIDSPVPLDIMHKIRIPVLLIHGDKDTVVSAEDSKKGYEIIKNYNPKNELYIVAGADHVFTERRFTEEVIEKTLEWLNSLALR